MARRKKNLSIIDIALKAGVSIGTVDRVLHNRGRVSEETKSRIQSLIKKNNYIPNVFASNLSRSREVRFGVVFPKRNQDSNYWILPMKGIQKASKELETYNVQIKYYHFDRYSEKSFERALQHASKDRLEGLLIAPILKNVAEEMIPKFCYSRPCVFIDSDVPGIPHLSTIIQDPYRSGILAANLMKKMIAESGTIVIAEIVPGDFHIDERIRGFREGIEEDRRFRLVLYKIESHKGENEFRSSSEKILGENSDLRGIFVSNAWTHPIARHVRSLTKPKEIMIVGYDLVEENKKCLIDGGIDVIISQRPEMQSYEGIHSLFRHTVLRARVDKKIMVPLDVLTKDNVDYYQS